MCSVCSVVHVKAAQRLGLEELRRDSPRILVVPNCPFVDVPDHISFVSLRFGLHREEASVSAVDRGPDFSELKEPSSRCAVGGASCSSRAAPGPCTPHALGAGSAPVRPSSCRSDASLTHT